ARARLHCLLASFPCAYRDDSCVSGADGEGSWVEAIVRFDRHSVRAIRGGIPLSRLTFSRARTRVGRLARGGGERGFVHNLPPAAVLAARRPVGNSLRAAL